ncbi:MAG: hypothetical protein MMC23_009549 [Stictis urceolatum]|nr:hypothetical protein [Stictis urceolata]
MAPVLDQGNHLHDTECKHWRAPGWDNNGDIERGLTRVGVIGDGPPMVLDPDDPYDSGEEDDEEEDLEPFNTQQPPATSSLYLLHPPQPQQLHSFGQLPQPSAGAWPDQFPPS